jgi:quaternary ammonium compound-resistance protein SugE
MALSVYLLALSLQTLPLGTAYSIWTGIGAVGAVIYGILFFSESKDILKILFVMMIIGGIIGLKLTTSDKPQNKQQETTENIGN